MKRKATAVWEGSGKEGKGNLSTASGAIKNAKYSSDSRFSNEPGTNPEELVAAAHAGCFAMKLSFNLSEAGHVPDRLEARATVSIEDGTVTSSHIELDARVDGIDQSKFEELVEHARQNCPISKLLKADIKVTSKLN